MSNGKGSKRRPEDPNKIRENWPLGLTKIEQWLRNKEISEKLGSKESRKVK